jgi:hypothetical protein
MTGEQAQLVYDLAAERLVPMLHEMAAEDRAEREVERLVAQFGGESQWREAARQMLAWGRRHLPKAALEGLAGSYEGVMALHRMMAEGEPRTLSGAADGSGLAEADLHAMMRDPRYWRDRDSRLVDRVTDGFRRLFGER